MDGRDFQILHIIFDDPDIKEENRQCHKNEKKPSRMSLTLKRRKTEQRIKVSRSEEKSNAYY
jgi:hypothetical protein